MLILFSYMKENVYNKIKEDVSFRRRFKVFFKDIWSIELRIEDILRRGRSMC